MAAVSDTFTAHDAYLETQVLTATPIQLRLMLIEGAQRFARLAREAFAQGRNEDGQVFLGRCQQVLVELLGSLQPQKNSVSQSLVGVYAFLVRSVAEAILRQQPEQLDEVCRVLDEEQATWRQLVDRDGGASPTEVFSDRAPEAFAVSSPVERFDLNM